MAYPYRQPYGPRDNSHATVNGMDSRGGAGLMRRFTTNALPTLSPMAQQRRQAAGDNSLHGLQNKFAPSERRIRHIEKLLEQQRQINAELEKVDDDTRREVEDGLRHERAISDIIAQSEPTTPPEHRNSLQSVTTRPNRYSSTTLTSPPGITGRPNRSSTQLTSPPVGSARPYSSTSQSILPSQSVPGSRRHSDDEEEEVNTFFYDPSIGRSAANPNRNSMPVTSYDRKRNVADLRSSLGALDHTNFIFEDDDEPSALPKRSSNRTSPPDTKTYLQVQHTADGFPKLIRREDSSEVVAGSSVALDLAFAHLSNGEKQVAERATASGHRISLPPIALSSSSSIAPLNSILAHSNDIKTAANSRRSLEVKFSTEAKRPALMATPPRGLPNGMAKTQASYSTNDIPTLKSIDGEQTGGVPISSPSTQVSTAAESVAHDLGSLNLDRPLSNTSSKNAAPHHSIDFNITNGVNHDVFTAAGLQTNGTSFGAPQSQDTSPVQPFQAANMPYTNSPFYAGYGMQPLNNGFNMNMSGGYRAQAQWPNQVPFQPTAYNGFQQYPQNGQAVAGAGHYPDSNRATLQQRKTQAEDLFAGIALSDLAGQIYGLCKDQHGCRFLQKKLEEHNDADVKIIFDEVKDQFQDLMIDPFGNYLCQRLLEHCNDDQRTVLVESAVPAMTRVALNQHGTRALQRMIEFISTPEQINMLIAALRHDVVHLIQDLNGNHVIQKCLNHLSAQDAQFILDAVAANCVVVGTHRHGCCVVQRCVDHATGLQKGAMVDSVIANAFALVQDPFGNYVVQYILDLSEPCFTEPLCRSFAGNIAYLSKQKFSSNVIEKCIRCASIDTRRLLISEINSPQELERMLRDSFANYVVQTAMECADEELKAHIFDNLRPMLPAIRNTPHGRRIQNKIQDHDNGGTAPMTNANIRVVPAETAQVNGSAMPQQAYGPPVGRANRMGMVGAPSQWMNNNPFSNPHGAGLFGEAATTSPQRSQAYQTLNGNQGYPAPSFSPPGFQGFGRPPPAYGHF